MRAEVSQPSVVAPGVARLLLRDAPPFDPAHLAFSIESPPRGFLQDAAAAAPDAPAWGAAQVWLRPDTAAMGSDGLELTIGPARTWHLRPNVTYVLRVRDHEGRDHASARVAWPAIRMPSEPPAPPPRPAPPAPELPAPELPAPEPPPAPVPPPAPPPLSQPPLSPPSPGRRWLWAAVAVLLVAAGGAAWWALHRPPAPIAVKPPDAAPSTPEAPPSIASARARVQAQGDDAAALYAEAQRYLKAGTPEALQGGLILLTQAAEKGSGPAATAIGRMYDPDTFAPGTSAMKGPDAENALLWYQRAAKANDPEGLYRLGTLLMSGRAAAPGLGPEQGATYLQKAAELGSKDAQAELDKLRPAAKPK